jgi:thiol-disulfide isomerase/thioredoxin
MPKSLKWGFVGIVILFAGLCTLSYFYFQESRQPPVSASDQMDFSAIEVQDESGKAIKLNQVISGKGAFLSFWATWCEPCLEEIPTLLASPVFRSVSLTWINMDYGSYLDRLKEVRQWKNKNHISLNTLFDSQGQLTEILKIEGLPLNVLVSSAGKILWIKMGEMEESDFKDVAEKIQNL